MERLIKFRRSLIMYIKHTLIIELLKLTNV